MDADVKNAVARSSRNWPLFPTENNDSFLSERVDDLAAMFYAPFISIDGYNGPRCRRLEIFQRFCAEVSCYF